MDQKRNQTGKGGRATKRWLKRGVTAVVAASLIGGVVLAVLPNPVPVESKTVDKGPLSVTVDEDGVTRVKDRYVVSAPLTGNLARIELNPGDIVKQGDLLARILPLRAPLLDARSRNQAVSQVARASAAESQSVAQIERARAAVDYARKEAATTQELFHKNAISPAELDRVLAELRAREAELASAQFGDKVAAHELSMARAALGRYDGRAKDSIDQFEVPSPISGRVLKAIQQSESVVQAGAPLLELGDPRALEIAVDVLTTDAVHIKPSSQVLINGWGGKALSAAVRLVEPSAFTRVSALGVEEQRVNAVVDLTAPYSDWTDLGDGYRVEAHIQVYHAKEAIRVPAGALFRSGEKWAVFVVDAGVARLRQLKVLRRNDLHAEVAGGISPGERVIVHPSDQVADGTQVAPN